MAPMIRVLRLLEYLYENVETMDRDMRRWDVQGAFTGDRMIIRSTTLPPTTLLAPLPSKLMRCPWASAAGSCEHPPGHEGKHSFEENE